ncbi:hypothetical protein BaRGS_00015620 [Batillaria attramentaria]|uniref:Secreted protein n=1 Tax=Batillaria attramentaria TaxID=370345 RepID=A0ABD0L112_9CAEN
MRVLSAKRDKRKLQMTIWRLGCVCVQVFFTPSAHVVGLERCRNSHLSKYSQKPSTHTRLIDSPVKCLRVSAYYRLRGEQEKRTSRIVRWLSL